MQEKTFWIDVSDKLSMFTYYWIPNNNQKVKAIILMIHGSVEHAGRYKDFAKLCCNKGYKMYAPDLRGHGKTAEKNGKFSYFADKDGWAKCLYDIAILENHIRKYNPMVPVFIYGHSMGSFIVREYISQNKFPLKGVMLTGSSYGKTSLVKIGILAAKFLLIFNSKKAKSPLLHHFIYNTFNKQINNPKTKVDFTTTDPEMAQKYLDDPLTGRTVTIEYALELAKATLRTATPEIIKATPDIPLLLLSGEEDPVGGNNGDEVTQLYDLFIKEGKKLVEMDLIPNARHELVNELDRETIMKQMVSWFDSKLK